VGLVKIVFLLALGACSSALTSHAERGDVASVRTEVVRTLKARELEEDDVRDTARATARHLLSHQHAEALTATMRTLSPCAQELESEFETIADRDDPIALAILADADRIGTGRLTQYRDHSDARLRALGARTLVGEANGASRRKALLDPSPEVRRGAMRAALQQPSAADEADLLDAARRDPDPYVRSTALRVLAIVPSRSERLVGLLWDLWESSDDAGRETLATSFALRPLYERGGRDVLRVLLAQRKGPGVIAGALAAARAAGPAMASQSDDVRDLARSALVEHARIGTQRERLFVLASTPLDWQAMLDTVRTNSTDSDSAVAVRAWTRRAESEPAAAKLALRSFATREDQVGTEARGQLARLGDLTVQGKLERDLASGSPLAKRAAVSGLIALGRMPRAAIALSDPDTVFRADAACMLMRP
jgi:HEAT repeat protein